MKLFLRYLLLAALCKVDSSYNRAATVQKIRANRIAFDYPFVSGSGILHNDDRCKNGNQEKVCFSCWVNWFIC